MYSAFMLVNANYSLPPREDKRAAPPSWDVRHEIEDLDYGQLASLFPPVKLLPAALAREVSAPAAGYYEAYRVSSLETKSEGHAPQKLGGTFETDFHFNTLISRIWQENHVKQNPDDNKYQSIVCIFEDIDEKSIIHQILPKNGPDETACDVMQAAMKVKLNHSKNCTDLQVERVWIPTSARLGYMFVTTKGCQNKVIFSLVHVNESTRDIATRHPNTLKVITFALKFLSSKYLPLQIPIMGLQVDRDTLNVVKIHNHHLQKVVKAPHLALHIDQMSFPERMLSSVAVDGSVPPVVSKNSIVNAAAAPAAPVAPAPELADSLESSRKKAFTPTPAAVAHAPGSASPGGGMFCHSLMPFTLCYNTQPSSQLSGPINLHK